MGQFQSHEPETRHGRRPALPCSVQLLCFPYAGSSAATYVRWRRRCAPWIDVVPVELPGRGRLRADALQTSVAEIVDQIARRTRPDLGRPFALFGHSLGAIVAFEYARRLRAEGRAAPILFFASGAPAPCCRERDGRAIPQSDAELRAELGRLGGTPSAVLSSSELMQLALPVLRADFQAEGSYRCLPCARIASPIHAVGGTQDEVGGTALAAWRDHGEGAFFLNLIPGGHFFLHESETELLGLIERSLWRQLSHGRTDGPTASAYDAARTPASGGTA